MILLKERKGVTFVKNFNNYYTILMKKSKWQFREIKEKG